MQIDLSKISGAKKQCWWFNPKDGMLEYIGEFEGNKMTDFQIDIAYNSGNDRVLIAVNSEKDYIKKGVIDLLVK